jgi:hypothetical protein
MRTMRRAALVLALSCAFAAMPGSAQDRGSRGGAEPRPNASANLPTGAMRIRLKLAGGEVTATLLDNATARDFVSLLPLELTLEDHASTEKIAHPPRKLSTAGAPAGADPDVGDIAYYAPWGNLAIYYRDFGYSAGLVKLGRIDGDIRPLAVRGTLKVTIEAVE